MQAGSGIGLVPLYAILPRELFEGIFMWLLLSPAPLNNSPASSVLGCVSFDGCWQALQESLAIGGCVAFIRCATEAHKVAVRARE
jgi:hypothetical protein